MLLVYISIILVAGTMKRRMLLIKNKILILCEEIELPCTICEHEFLLTKKTTNMYSDFCIRKHIAKRELNLEGCNQQKAAKLD